MDHHGSVDDEGHADHHHDDFDSVVVEARVESREAVVLALRSLVDANTIYRVKGFAALPGTPMRLVVQGVGAAFRHLLRSPVEPAKPRSERAASC